MTGWIDLSGFAPRYFPDEVVHYANSLIQDRVLFGTDIVADVETMTPDLFASRFWALRTLLAWGLYASERRRPDLNRLRGGRSWASQDLERDLFGRDPNHDWLRALHVEDSRAINRDALALRTVRVSETPAPTPTAPPTATPPP